MEIINPETNWKTWQLILFRFFFAFLSLLSLIAYNQIIQTFNVSWEKQTAFFGHLKGFAAWMDRHFFHLGYLPAAHSLEFSDTHFGVIITLTIFTIALIAAGVWTFLGKAKNYNRFYYWFSNYIAYYIFLAMMPYAIEKIIPIQAQFPDATELHTRLGSLLKWQLLFTFLGASPAYCMLCGWVEFLAATLLLFNRTRVLGALLMTIALIQVLSFNIFYNNSIILLASILLLSTLFITGRALPKLYDILIRLRPVSLAEYQYRFNTPWKKYMLILLCFIPVWKVYNTAMLSWGTYAGTRYNQQHQKFYKVSSFRRNNYTLAPLTTDTTLWRYVCFLAYSPRYQSMIKYDMQERTEQDQIKWDTLKHTITIFTRSDNGDKNSFDYKKLPGGDLELAGNWHGKSIAMSLTDVPVDSMTLIKDKFKFMQEDQ